MVNNYFILIINLVKIFIIFNILLHNRNVIKDIYDNLFNRTEVEDFTSYKYIHVPNYYSLINEDILSYIFSIFIEYLYNSLYPNYNNEIYSISIIFYQLNIKTGEYNRISDNCVFNFNLKDQISADELYNLIKRSDSEFSYTNDFFILFKMNSSSNN